jgi:hypothetical protein
MISYIFPKSRNYCVLISQRLHYMLSIMDYNLIILSISILVAAIILSLVIHRFRVTVRRSILALRDEYRLLRKLIENDVKNG